MVKVVQVRHAAVIEVGNHHAPNQQSIRQREVVGTFCQLLNAKDVVAVEYGTRFGVQLSARSQQGCVQAGLEQGLRLGWAMVPVTHILRLESCAEELLFVDGDGAGDVEDVAVDEVAQLAGQVQEAGFGGVELVRLAPCYGEIWLPSHLSSSSLLA